MRETEPVEDQPLVIDVGVEIVNAVTSELVKAVALLHGVDPMTASAMSGGLAGCSRAWRALRSEPTNGADGASSSLLALHNKNLDSMQVHFSDVRLKTTGSWSS